MFKLLHNFNFREQHLLFRLGFECHSFDSYHFICPYLIRYTNNPRCTVKMRLPFGHRTKGFMPRKYSPYANLSFSFVFMEWITIVHYEAQFFQNLDMCLFSNKPVPQRTCVSVIFSFCCCVRTLTLSIAFSGATSYEART